MRLGLFGGTFNPIHIAHLRIAEEALELATLDRVLFIPASDPPHKSLAGEADFSLRYNMVKKAIADNPAFDISDIEKRRAGKSYTVDTLSQLRLEQPEEELHFIIGSDSFLELGLWHRYPEIFKQASLIVVERPEKEILDPLLQLPEDVLGQFTQEESYLLRHSGGNVIRFFTGTRLDISSSRLREMVLEKQSIRYLVPPVIEKFIAQKGLYQHE